MTVFLGIDGGGTKTDFVLIDSTGCMPATRRAGPAYHVEIGFEALHEMLVSAVREMLASCSLPPSDLGFAFVGLPGYGENSAEQRRLDHILGDFLPQSRYRCDNDVVCAWAGALAGSDGIALVAGTGSIAYGELAGRRARVGGWGELFGDEGSAYWLAKAVLREFSRMSDGRAPRGYLYELVRGHFALGNDLDLCAKVYGPPALSRSELAALAPLATAAARAGDPAARAIFDGAATELAALVHAVRHTLGTDVDLDVDVSYCGGLLQPDGLLLPRFERALGTDGRGYELKPPRLTPAAGAAVSAARLAGTPLDRTALERLSRLDAGRSLP